MIQEVLNRLQELQEILAQKYEIESELSEIPKSLNTKSELVNRLNQSYLEKLERIATSEKRVHDLRLQMQEAEKSREQYEERIGNIETQREYESLIKEIRFASDKEDNYRKDLQKEEKTLIDMKQSIESDKQLIEEQTEELKKEREKIQEEVNTRNKIIEELNQKENRIIPNLDKDIVFKFERIIRSKRGKGIVPLRRSVCLGCNMILPSQFVNEVREEKEIKFCPYCSMILYYIEDKDSEEQISVDDFFLDDDDSFIDDMDDEYHSDIFADDRELIIDDDFEDPDEESANHDLDEDTESDDDTDIDDDDESVQSLDADEEDELMEELEDS